MSSNSKRTRRTLSEEFKRDAVNLIVSEGYSFRAVAEAVNVNENSLRNWHRRYTPEAEPCGPDATKEELRAELKRLRKNSNAAAHAQSSNEFSKPIPR
ncbi:transposase [Mariniblastus fucicola]|uniref:Transposase n=1 Tax=Mariniblastus fucicola TaxID=980251 RepID=A0A5B9PJE8_9BACT|nr:transposase [Mariniblastus fucicola]QEG24786.1 Transposase [Mariniblastus fucicola]